MNNLVYEITCETDLNKNNNNNEDILNNLYDFYGSDKNDKPTKEMERILPILSGKSKLSIRVIDWFVTNYAKKKNIVYPLIERNGYTTSYVNVYLDYKSLLKGYKKRLFDPFCRKTRIPFRYTNEHSLITTIAQLNFFKWAISNKILDYIEKHFDDINNDMNNSIKNKSSNSSDNTSTNDCLTDSSTSSDKKRHELSENANKTINCYRMKVIVEMN